MRVPGRKESGVIFTTVTELPPKERLDRSERDRPSGSGLQRSRDETAGSERASRGPEEKHTSRTKASFLPWERSSSDTSSELSEWDRNSLDRCLGSGIGEPTTSSVSSCKQRDTNPEWTGRQETDGTQAYGRTTPRKNTDGEKRRAGMIESAIKV
ncbi:hypothetical protein EYF80_009680 [Liparis tanakae]|uniref:Uncharacterized protein n=1 Tax=Liparis tanakae TaxID=230148 RepID=A0A4Z2IQC0_9TELE|nr:hypothetical protein EYF80_009680 [Liparis tanakae]